jgi:DNA-binding transcriptional regulator YiaG
MKSSDLVILAAARAAAADGSARALRQAARLTCAEVARAVGVSPSAISMWERGCRVPRGAGALAYGNLLAVLAAAALRAAGGGLR